MSDVNGVVFDDEVSLTVLIDVEEEGFSAQVEEGFTGSSTDDGGATLGELVNNVLDWAGISGLTFGDDDSLDVIRKRLASVQAEADESGAEFSVKVYTSF